MDKLGQEPAFAKPANFVKGYKETRYNNTPSDGMSKRFYAACMAIQGIISHNGFYWQGNGIENLNGVTLDFCAKLAFEYADELLKQENL